MKAMHTIQVMKTDTAQYERIRWAMRPQQNKKSSSSGYKIKLKCWTQGCMTKKVMKTKVHIYFKQTTSSETRLSKEVKELSGKRYSFPKKERKKQRRKERKNLVLILQQSRWKFSCNFPCKVKIYPLSLPQRYLYVLGKH